MWENSKFVAKQFERVGMVTARSLVGTGYTNFDAIAGADPRRLELVINRPPPFGNHIRDSARYVPKYDVKVIEKERKWNLVRYAVEVCMVNYDVILEKSTLGRKH